MPSGRVSSSATSPVTSVTRRTCGASVAVRCGESAEGGGTAEPGTDWPGEHDGDDGSGGQGAAQESGTRAHRLPHGRGRARSSGSLGAWQSLSERSHWRVPATATSRHPLVPWTQAGRPSDPVPVEPSGDRSRWRSGRPASGAGPGRALVRWGGARDVADWSAGEMVSNGRRAVARGRLLPFDGWAARRALAVVRRGGRRAVAADPMAWWVRGAGFGIGGCGDGRGLLHAGFDRAGQVRRHADGG